jgi:putative membrane protein
MMRRILFLAPFTCLTLGAQLNSTPLPHEPPPYVNNDHKFLVEAALDGSTAVELATIAVQKAASDAVKQFARQVIHDYSKAGDQLKEVAKRAKIDLPTALDEKHQSQIVTLSKLSGMDFDQAYVKDRLKECQQQVNQYDREVSGGADPDIKEYAGNTLPTLKEHLEAVKALDKNQRTKPKR